MDLMEHEDILPGNFKGWLEERNPLWHPFCPSSTKKSLYPEINGVFHGCRAHKVKADNLCADGSSWGISTAETFTQTISKPSNLWCVPKVWFSSANCFDCHRKKGGIKIKVRRNDSSFTATWLVELIWCEAALMKINILRKKSILMKWEHLLLCYFGDMRLKIWSTDRRQWLIRTSFLGDFFGCCRCNRATEDLAETQTVEKNKLYLHVVLICLANHMVIFWDGKHWVVKSTKWVNKKC